MKALLKNGQLIVTTSFDISKDVDLEGTNISSLPDNLSVGGSLYKDF